MVWINESILDPAGIAEEAIRRGKVQSGLLFIRHEGISTVQGEKTRGT